MKRKATALLIALVVLPQGTAHAAASDTVPESPPQHETFLEGPPHGADVPWQSFQSESEGFRVALPTTPELIRKTAKTLLGPIKETAYRARSLLGVFSVELHELPSISAWFAPARLVIAKARDSVLEDRSAEQLSFEMVKGERYPRGILSYRSAGTKFEIEEIHLVLAGKRLYLLAADIRKGSDRPAMQRFFDSFQVTERSK